MITVKRTRRMTGLGEIAKKLGVARQTVYQVATGRSVSARIEAELKANGIEVYRKVWDQ